MEVCSLTCTAPIGKKINTLIEIRKRKHRKHVSGVFSFFFHDTEKE